VNFQVLREEFNNNNSKIYLDITQDKETKTFLFKMTGKKSDEMYELAFTAAINSKFSNLVIIFSDRNLSQLLSQNLDQKSNQKIFGTHLIFT